MGHHAPGDRLRRALVLTVLILLVEAGGGLMAHSLALLSDAGHLLTDVGALGLAWFAVEQARRPADARRTYGYHRVGILAALANSLALIGISLWIGLEAARRLMHPEPVAGAVVVGAALAAVAVNGYIGLGLRESGPDLNLRAALLHVLGDLVASVGAVVAGLVLLTTGWRYADPLVSVGIAGLIAWGAVRLAIRTLHVLMEGTPAGTDLELVADEMTGTPGVVSVHDLHVWELAHENIALSCHLVVTERRLAEVEQLVRGIEQRLCSRFGIAHTTIQIESCQPCEGELGHGVGQHNHPHVRT